MPEERKVVTTLFCDLVGFTAMSKAADPKDVDAVLRSLSTANSRALRSATRMDMPFRGRCRHGSPTQA
jgi:class 3 adenylate cyclase